MGLVVVVAAFGEERFTFTLKRIGDPLAELYCLGQQIINMAKDVTER